MEPVSAPRSSTSAGGLLRSTNGRCHVDRCRPTTKKFVISHTTCLFFTLRRFLYYALILIMINQTSITLFRCAHTGSHCNNRFVSRSLPSVCCILGTPSDVNSCLHRCIAAIFRAAVLANVMAFVYIVSATATHAEYCGRLPWCHP